MASSKCFFDSPSIEGIDYTVGRMALVNNQENALHSIMSSKLDHIAGIPFRARLDLVPDSGEVLPLSEGDIVEVLDRGFHWWIAIANGKLCSCLARSAPYYWHPFPDDFSCRKARSRCT